VAISSTISLAERLFREQEVQMAAGKIRAALLFTNTNN